MVLTWVYSTAASSVASMDGQKVEKKVETTVGKQVVELDSPMALS